MRHAADAAGLHRENKESLKIFKDRGNVCGFFPTEDDFQAHRAVLDQVPNLDLYGDGNNRQIGCIIKDSLGNALRVTRPVVMDEGHKGYSKLAQDTLYGFNPNFVLELSGHPDGPAQGHAADLQQLAGGCARHGPGQRRDD